MLHLCIILADLQCSFSKESTCKWENGQTDDFDWSIGKTTPSLNTGPNSDHTTTNGKCIHLLYQHYLYHP